MSVITVSGGEGRLTASIRLDRGAEVAQATFAGRDLLAIWPPRPMPASVAGEFEASRSTWLATYRGGWQELLPSTGDASAIGGQFHPFHGAASAARWRLVDVGEEELTCEWRSSDQRLSAVKRIGIDRDRPELRIQTCIRNRRRTGEQMLLWGHHPAFRVVRPTTIRLACACSASGRRCGGCEEGVVGAAVGDSSSFATRPAAAGWAEIERGDGITVRLTWDPSVFPAIWLWSECGSSTWPIPGDVDLVAVEPQRATTPDGLAAAVARGEALTLPAGSDVRTCVTLSVNAAAGDLGRGRSDG